METSRPSELRSLVQRLIEKAFFVTYDRKPGALIKRLSKEDRDLCKQLTAKDFEHRV